MDLVDATVAKELHGHEVNPYAISVSYAKVPEGEGADEFHLRLAILDAYKESVVDKVMSAGFEFINLRTPSLKLKAVRKECTEVPLKDFAQMFHGCPNDPSAQSEPLVKPTSRRIKLHFDSPTSFRSGGEYQIFPTPRLILQSLAVKYAVLTGQDREIGDSILESFAKSVRISSYSLRTNFMPIEGVKIPAFIGTVTLSVHGSDTLKRHIRMLCEFGRYFGCGIKSSMGMGSLEVLREEQEVCAKCCSVFVA
ncbi:MAG: CRISPR system precrRNA processing endoribonuclease RAMP protein Cas6 [Candidatus Ancillula sp.]|jgi:CRISPR-associated endoribonuclease Cas6|nr:CRISPR system precrRNA processing endoribonuclease RAMP protein Cas6 [Candidatus Ancillula sp.]